MPCIFPCFLFLPSARRSCSSFIQYKPKSARANRLAGLALAHSDETAKGPLSALPHVATVYPAYQTYQEDTGQHRDSEEDEVHDSP